MCVPCPLEKKSAACISLFVVHLFECWCAVHLLESLHQAYLLGYSRVCLLCQLRYYDAMEDSHCKGFIDLAEVVSVQPVKNMPGAPKKADENSFIEVMHVLGVDIMCKHFYQMFLYLPSL